MAKFELTLPKMGESVAEATLTTWLKEVGDTVELDDAVVEIATDKVDSEVPSEVEGILVEKLFEVDDVVQVGQAIAIIETANGIDEVSTVENKTESIAKEEPKEAAIITSQIEEVTSALSEPEPVIDYSESNKFYSPLVKNIASEENVSLEELETLSGTGKEGRVTKNDILEFVKNRNSNSNTTDNQKPFVKKQSAPISNTIISSGEDEIIEMSRMGKLIANHMVDSVQTSAHVQSFIETDVTSIWNWRKKVKDGFYKREGENLTFTPIFMEAVAKALKDFPLMNVSVSGDTIIKKKNINIGMAAALPDGNLIVPVIKNADQLNLVGMAKVVNDLANNARNNSLKPDDVQDGTFTVTNIGSFGSIMGTPIINQPQVGILALGAIRKVPAVIETPDGDFIGIRHKMFLSHSYDHRVVNGALGSLFLKQVSDYLESWDINREI